LQTPNNFDRCAILLAAGDALLRRTILRGWSELPSAALDVPKGFKSAPRRNRTTRADARWWRLFKDDTLNQLEESAIRANTDLGRRRRPASPRPARRPASLRASFIPWVTLDPSIIRSRTSGVSNNGSALNGTTSARANCHEHSDPLRCLL